MTGTRNVHGLLPVKCTLGKKPNANMFNLGLVKSRDNAEFRSLKELDEVCTIEGEFVYAAPFGDTEDLVVLVSIDGNVQIRRISGRKSELIHSFNVDMNMEERCVSQTQDHQILLTNRERGQLKYLKLFPSLVDPLPTKINFNWSYYYDKLDTIIGVAGGKVVFQSTVTIDTHAEDFPVKKRDIKGVSMAENKYVIWTN